MLKLILCFFAASPLFADPPLTLFEIIPSVRGPDISTIVATFNMPPYVTAQSEVGIQTTSDFIITKAFAPYVIGRFIPYVTSAASSVNGTLMTITYLPNGPSTVNQYLIVPIEKIVAVMFSPNAIFPNSSTQSVLTSTFPTGELPRYDIDPSLRAADLLSVFTTFNDPAGIFKTVQSAIGIFTTLSGPFNPPIVGGFIPNVQTMFALGPFLTITYLPLSSNGRTFNSTNAIIIVTAEQVVQMVYYPNGIPSSSGF